MSVDVKKYNFGIIGMGFLGSAITHGFALHADIKIYDKFKDYDTLEDVVKHAEFIWMCLPTPMDMQTGEIDLSILEENLDAIHDLVTKEDEKVVIIKSTVVPGTTRAFSAKYPKLNFVMNPEFLTARNNRLDFICASRIIIGAPPDALCAAAGTRLHNAYAYRFGNSVPIYRTSWEQAELTKYGANCFFAMKISYFNYMYEICERLGLKFDEVRDMILADGRIGRSHCNVPGWDGQRGYSGSCLAAGSLILTDGGYKDISEISVNDMVFDSDGFTKVNRTGIRRVDDVVEVKARGRSIVGSPDHIHMVRDGDDIVQKQLQHITNMDWLYIPRPKLTPIDSVYIGPKPKCRGLKFWHERVSLNRDIARLMGLFVGDGFSGIYNSSNGKKEYSVNWTFGKHEVHLVDEVISTLDSLGLKSNKKIKISENATFGRSETWHVRCRSRWLYTFFDVAGLGHNSHNKNAPILSGQLAEGFISGWLDADGNYYKKTGTISGFSRSTELIKKIDAMLLNIGICSFMKKGGQEINISMRSDVHKISSWMRSKRFCFDDHYIRDKPYASPTMREFSNGWVVKVSHANTISGPIEVYPIETDSGLYTANMFLTHNCFPKDINALIKFSEGIGVDPELLEASWSQNLRDRPSKDWEDIPSAVSNKDDEDS